MKTEIYNNIYEEMLSKKELKNCVRNEQISAKVLREILAYTNMNVSFSSKIDTYAQRLFELKYQRLYGSKYMDKLYRILAKYNYDMGKEIKDAMIYLSHLEDPSKNKEMIKTFLNSKVIQDITFDGTSTFTISSDTYGTFSFEPASYHFKDNEQITKYINNHKTRRECHANTLFLSAVLKDAYAITSLCPFEFGGTYHHSYTYDKTNNQVIDLARNTIMNKEEYDRLLKPQEVSIIPNDEVMNEALITMAKAGPSKWCAIIKIALYKEYLNQIGYQGSLIDAPYVKQKK